MSFSSDEVNYLVYRYLLESGSTYAFMLCLYIVLTRLVGHQVGSILHRFPCRPVATTNEFR